MNFWEKLPEIDNHRLFIALGRYIETIKKRNINTINHDNLFSIYYTGNAPAYNIIYYPDKIIINNRGLTFYFSEFMFECLMSYIADTNLKSTLNKFSLYKKDFIFFIKCELI